jgi:hypothetical protein
VLCETDLVCVVGVCFIRIDGFRSIRIFGRCSNIGCLCRLTAYGSCGDWRTSRGVRSCRTTKPWLRSISVSSDRTTGISSNWRRGFESVELCGGIHLRCLGVYGLWSVVVSGAHGPAVAHRASLLFMKGKGVDISAGSGLGCRSKVEHPDNLKI